MKMIDTNQDIPLQGTKSKKPFDIIGFVIRYGLLVAVLGAFIMTMLVPLVLKLKKPDYEVHAALRIDPVIPSLITKSEQPSIAGFYHDYVRTQAKRITETTMLAKVVEGVDSGLSARIFPAGFSVDEKIAFLQRIITVVPVSRTHILRLTIRGPKKEGLAEVLNLLIETYLETLAADLEKKDNRRLAYLSEKKKRLREEIERKEMDLKGLTTNVLSSTFVEDFNIWQQKVVGLQKAHVAALSDRVRAENILKYGKDSAEKLQKLSLSALVEEGIMEDDAIDFTSSWTYQKLQEMRGSIDGITAENEDRRRIEQRMGAMRDYEEKLRHETRETVKNIVYGKQDLELKKRMIKQDNDLKEARASEKQLEDELTEAQRASAVNSTLMLKGKALEKELNHDRDLLFRIDTRIHELEAESRAPLRVHIESLAREPKHPSGSNIKKLLMVCIGFSFGSVAMIFFLVELFDDRVRGPKHIADALGHPPSWPISLSPNGVPFSWVLSRSPGAAAAKALRSLSTRLFREHRGRGAQVFLFTSVESGCGTTDITGNTAQALAYQSTKVLILDANLKRWEDEGEDDFSKEADPFEAIQHDSSKGVDYLVSFMPRQSTRAASTMLSSFIKKAREKYDFICIDAEPVLQSDLTEYLAVNSDVTILIAQGDSTTYSRLRQAAEILIRLDVPALAPVLNWGGYKILPWFERYIDRLSEAAAVIMPGKKIRVHNNAGKTVTA